MATLSVGNLLLSIGVATETVLTAPSGLDDGAAPNVPDGSGGSDGVPPAPAYDGC